MKLNTKRLLALGCAAAMLLPTSAYAKMPETGNKLTETVLYDDDQNNEIPTITSTAAPITDEALSAGTVDITADAPASIINTSETAKLIKDVNFNIEAGSSSLSDSQKNLTGALLIAGKVQFENCTFTVNGKPVEIADAESDENQAQTSAQIEEGNAIVFYQAEVDFLSSNVQAQNLNGQLFYVDGKSDVKFENSHSSDSSNAAASLYIGEDSKVEFEQSSMDILLTTTEENAVELKGKDSELDLSNGSAFNLTGTDEKKPVFTAASGSKVNLESSTMSFSNIKSAAFADVEASDSSSISVESSEAGITADTLDFENSSFSAVANAEKKPALTIAKQLDFEGASTLNLNSASNPQLVLDKDAKMNLGAQVSGEVKTVEAAEKQVTNQSSLLSFELIDKDGNVIGGSADTNNSGKDDSNTNDENNGDTDTGKGDSTNTENEKPAEDDKGNDSASGENPDESNKEDKTLVKKVDLQYVAMGDGSDTKTPIEGTSLPATYEIPEGEALKYTDEQAIADIVKNLDKGIDGYEYVDYDKTFDEATGTLTIELNYKVKDSYVVYVWYVNEADGEKIGGLQVKLPRAYKEGEEYDASQYIGKEIKGYTYVKTEGNVKGVASGSDHNIIIKCLYKKDKKATATTDKNENKKPDKTNGTNTSTNMNVGMYIGIAAAALVAIILIIVFSIKGKKKNK